jgi:hypothetical protein
MLISLLNPRKVASNAMHIIGLCKLYIISIMLACSLGEYMLNVLQLYKH